uniref:Uncharacterized protein n=1 Tax=Anguilla anguilla TaxID=7936 RepID=A0A0E9PQJ6_ANGAN
MSKGRTTPTERDKPKDVAYFCRVRHQ